MFAWRISLLFYFILFYLAVRTASLIYQLSILKVTCEFGSVYSFTFFWSLGMNILICRLSSTYMRYYAGCTVRNSASSYVQVSQQVSIMLVPTFLNFTHLFLLYYILFAYTLIQVNSEELKCQFFSLYAIENFVQICREYLTEATNNVFQSKCLNFFCTLALNINNIY